MTHRRAFKPLHNLYACCVLLLAACGAQPGQPTHAQLVPAQSAPTTKAPLVPTQPAPTTNAVRAAPALAATAQPESSGDVCNSASRLCREEDFANANRTNTALNGDWTEFDGQRAYLSLPRGVEAPMPAILLLHSARGLTKNMKLWSDRLAEDGYAVLAIDFYDGKIADTDPEAFALRDHANAKADRNVATAKAAYARLSSDPRVRARRVALVGWSYGGAWATYLSTELPGVAAVVTYAGNAVGDTEMARRIKAPVLMIRGADDQVFEAEKAAKFEDRLETAGKHVELLSVDGGHALSDPTREGYSATGDWAAFVRVRQFLKAHLAP